MKAIVFLCGLLIGAVGAVAGMTYLKQPTRAPDDNQIVLADKNFYDNNEDNEPYGMVRVSGTLTAKGPVEGQAYPNNTYAVVCKKGPETCEVFSIEQIGPKQMGKLGGPWVYPVVKWDPYEIVASDEPNSTKCVKVTITIEREQQTLSWIEEPVNQTTPQCEHVDTTVRKYTLEDSPGWKELNATKN